MARDLELRPPLLGRVDVVLGEEGRGQGAQLHGLGNLIVGAVADVDILHHGRVGGKALRLAQDRQWRVSPGTDRRVRTHARVRGAAQRRRRRGRHCSARNFRRVAISSVGVLTG